MQRNLNIYPDLPDRLFVSGIGTDVGKTYVSAWLCQHFGYAYWKPIQCGDLEKSDTIYIQSNTHQQTYTERYQFHKACSPHEAASIENTYINLSDFILPTADKIIVEGAGGILVPLNDKETIADLIKYLELPVCIVIRDYLGCINHSLLTIKYLEENSISIAFIVFNGEFVPATRDILAKHLSKYYLMSID